jgi:hypothetical protein
VRASSTSTRKNYIRYLDIDLMLFELLGLTKYVRYLDIELMLFEQLSFTNYVRYLDIDFL